MPSLLDEQYYRASEEKHNPRLRDERWERSHPVLRVRDGEMQELNHLSVERQAQVRYLRASGWNVSEIAAKYGVHRRTIYRYLDGEVVNVKVGDCVAPFRVRKGRDPVRVGKWERAA